MTSRLAHKEAFRVLAGKQLGRGCYRKVYECLVDPSLVVKVEDTARSFANVQEWGNWCSFQDTPVGTWMAPCMAISPCGLILLQKRVKLVGAENLPPSMPEFLTDLHDGNFGLFEGRVVCCDYATIIAEPRLRRRKVNWR